MAFSTTSASVTNTASQIVNPTTGSVSDPVPVLLWNNDASNTIFIGGSNVTTGNGWPIKAGTGISCRLMASDPIFAIAAVAGPLDLRVMIGRQ